MEEMKIRILRVTEICGKKIMLYLIQVFLGFCKVMELKQTKHGWSSEMIEKGKL